MTSFDCEKQKTESTMLFKVNKEIIYATGLLIHVGCNDYIEYKVKFAYNQINKLDRVHFMRQTKC